MAVPGTCVDVGPSLDEDARNLVIFVLQGTEERTVFVVVLNVDIVAALQQHTDGLRIAGRGRKVERRCAVFAACDDDGGSGGEDRGDGNGTVEFAWVAVEEEDLGTGKRVDGYVALGGVAEPAKRVEVQEEAEVGGGGCSGDEDGGCEETNGIAGMGKVEGREKVG